MKFVSFVTAPEGHNQREFVEWFINEHVPAILEGAATLRGGVTRRRIEPPAHIQLPMSPVTRDEIMPCDILMELWFSSCEDFRREIIPIERRLRAERASFISYRVTPRLQKDPRIVEAGATGSRPEITFIGSLKWLPGISPAFAADEWDEHTAIALRVQPTMTKYEQNLVREVISRSPGMPPIDAYADFSFNKVADFVSSFAYTEEEAQDVSTFRHRTLVTFFEDAEPMRLK